MFSRNTKSKSTALVLMLGLVSPFLVACDPPMPPDVLAALAEKTVTCETGDVAISAPDYISASVDQVSLNLADACQDPLMSITRLESTEQAPAIVLASQTPANCTPFASAPYLYDAAGLTFNLGDITDLNLSASTLASILNGEITDWSDEAIVADNPETEIPSGAIKVRTAADENSLEALKNFLASNKLSLEGQFEATSYPETGTDSDLALGEIAIVPVSFGLQEGLNLANLVNAEIDPVTEEKAIAVPGVEGIYSASTQVKLNSTAAAVTAVFDPGIKPTPVFTGESAANPYGAIYPINIYLCGQDNLVTRAAAAYLLRMDSQAVFSDSAVNALPELTRAAALTLVRKGLPDLVPSEK